MTIYPKIKALTLPLYYLVLISFIIGGIVYFNYHHLKQSAPTSSNDLMNVLRAPSDQARGMGLYDIGGTIVYEGSCSDKSPYAQLPINTSSLQIFNSHYFGDATNMWIEYGNGCDTPVQISLNPPIDRESFSTIEDTWLARDKHGLIAMVPSGEKSDAGFPLFTAKRLPEITDADFKYIESTEGSSDAFIEDNNTVYYYQYGTSSLSPVPGLTADITKVYYTFNGFYVLTNQAVFNYSILNRYYPVLIQLTGMDPKSFHKIVSDYWGDANSVLLGTTTIQGASSSDFKALYKVGSLNDQGDAYYSSNGNVYLGTTKIASTPFYELPGQPTFDTGACGGASYWSNGQSVFYAGMDLGANPNALKFSFFPGVKCQAIGYAWDGTKFFFQGKLIPSIEPASFRVIQNEYARDTDHVYDEGVLMAGNPDQLEKAILDGTIKHEYSDDGY